MLTKIAMKILSRAMRKDPGYAWSWHCNIAMVAQDAGASHKLANERTADFMYRAFGVKIIELGTPKATNNARS